MPPLHHINTWYQTICFCCFLLHLQSGLVHHVSEKTPTHIVGYKLRNSCLILIICDTEIPDII